MAATIEQICISKIEGSIRAIKNGKSPKDANPEYFFKKLRPLNEGMYQDLMNNYTAVVKKYNEEKS